MNSSKSLNLREPIARSISGLLAGLLGWIFIEAGVQGLRMFQPQPDFGGAIAAFLLYSGLVGGMVSAATAQGGIRSRWSHFWPSFLVCFFIFSLAAFGSGEGTFTGIVFPEAAGESKHFGDVNFLLSGTVWAAQNPGAAAYLPIARVLAFVLIGANLGLGTGLTTLSWSNAIKGGIGGAVGGLVGGLGFLGFEFVGVPMARMVGFSSMGAGIGFFIGLAHELTKVAWITIEVGRFRGREFRLQNRTVTLGRAEENEIGLFGDAQIAARHASIERDGNRYLLRNFSGAATSLNGRPIDAAELHNGDRIRIGSFTLAFHSRTKGTVSAGGTERAEASAGVPGAAASAGRGVDGLLVDSLGRTLRLDASRTMRIGREPDNDIVISNPSVSRHHAEIFPRNGGFYVRDLQSRNGTEVNGRRGDEERLLDEARVRFGDVEFTFGSPKEHRGR